MSKTQTKFDLKTEATKPLFAGVGVTDLAVEVVRDFVSETQARFAVVQKDVTARVVDVQKTASNPKALREQAVTAVTALSNDAKARRKAIEARVLELQAEAKAYPAKVQTLVDDNYTELVKRGESLVGRIRRQESTQATVKSAKTTVAKAKTTTTQAKKATATATSTAKTTTLSTVKKTAKAAAKPVAKKAAATKSSAKATVTAAEKTATNAVKAVADAAVKLGD